MCPSRLLSGYEGIPHISSLYVALCEFSLFLLISDEKIMEINACRTLLAYRITQLRPEAPFNWCHPSLI